MPESGYNTNVHGEFFFSNFCPKEIYAIKKTLGSHEGKGQD